MNKHSWPQAIVRTILISVVGLIAARLAMAHQPHDPIAALGVSPNYAVDRTVLVATDYLSINVATYAMMRSTDGGTTWKVLGNLPNSHVSAIVFSPGYAADQTIFVGTSGSLLRSTNQGQAWVPVGGAPLTTAIQGLVTSPAFVSDHTVFTITNQSVFRSVNGGTVWSPLPTTAGMADLTAMAISPNYATDLTLLVGTKANGIYKSIDGGGSWSLATTGLLLPQINTLAVSPSFSSDQTIFAGTEGAGFYRSSDSGNTWSASNGGITDLRITALALSPTFASDTTLWISANEQGVFKSADKGLSWIKSADISRELPPGQTDVHYRVMATGGGVGTSTLYIGMYEGLWSSVDQAASWLYIDIIPTRIVRYLKLSPNYANDRTVFATTYGGGNLWSSSAGATWTFRNTGMRNSYPDASGISPNFAVDGIAFSGMGAGLQRTTTSGSSWTLMQMLSAPTYPRGLDVSPNFASDMMVFIGTDNRISGNPATAIYNGNPVPNQGLFRSVDRGFSWIPTTLGGPPIDNIAVSPAFAADQTVFAGSAVTGLYKSTDAGVNWSSLPIGGAPRPVLRIAFSPAYGTDQTIFVATTNAGIFKSTNNGASWSLLPNTPNITALDLAVSPNYAADQTLFVGTLQKGVIRSTDGGQTFVPLTSFPDNYVTALGVSPSYQSDRTIFAASYNGIYRSTNGGATWTYTAEPARTEEDRLTSINFGGTWQRTVATQASTSALQTTLQSSATATFQFTGSGVRWVGSKGPQQGRASIQLDGVDFGMVTLTQATTQMQQNLWEQRALACEPHTLTITAALTGNQGLSVDAFDTWQDTCQ